MTESYCWPPGASSDQICPKGHAACRHVCGISWNLSSWYRPRDKGTKNQPMLTMTLVMWSVLSGVTVVAGASRRP